jgi:hypothetical protein
VVEAGEGDVVDAGFGAPFEGLGDILGVAFLVGAYQQAVLFVGALAVGEFLGDAILVVRVEFAVVELYLAWPVVLSQEMLIRPAAALSSRLTPLAATGSEMFLSTLSTCEEVIDMKKISSTRSTSIIGATWNSGSPSPPPPPPAMVLLLV